MRKEPCSLIGRGGLLLVSLAIACEAGSLPPVGSPDSKVSRCRSRPIPLSLARPMRRPVSLSKVADLAFDEEGISAEVQIPLLPSAQGLILRLSPSAPKQGNPSCVGIHSLLGPMDQPWVTPPLTPADRGIYCDSCPQRVSVSVGSGTYILPSNDKTPSLDGPLRLRAALRDCPTFLSARPSVDQRLSVEAAGLSPPPEGEGGKVHGVVPLVFVYTPSSVYHDKNPEPPNPESLLAAVNRHLGLRSGPIRLSAVLAGVVQMDEAPADPLSFEPGEHSIPERALSSAASCVREIEKYHGQLGGPLPVIKVLFAGCLSLQQPVLMRRDEPEGYSLHLPSSEGLDGGMGASMGTDGILLKGRGCIAGSPPFAWPEDSLGKLIAHEVGHSLGLYHSVEADGRRDQLDDTDGTDLMYYRPLQSSAQGLTPAQVGVALRHPSLLFVLD